MLLFVDIANTESGGLTVKRAARGFTLIEILVVVSILAILAGILLVALGSVSRASKKKATVALLENARSMLAEYELTSKLPLAFDAGYTPSVAQLTAKQTELTNAGFPLFYAAGTSVAPGLVTADTEAYTGASATKNRRQMPAMVATGEVFSRLRAVPKNETSFGNLDPANLMNATDDVAVTTGPKYQVPLDAWGNPILFVYRSLTGVNEGYNDGDPSLAASYSNPARIKTATDGKPFFVSAGPDGNFSTGDDNLYSFETN